MATPFVRSVPGAVAPAVSARPVELENLRFLEAALAALVCTVRASRVRILTDLADLEHRASGALAAAERVRGAVEAGGLASRGSRACIEWDASRVGTVLRGREAGAHRSIAASAADMVEAAFSVARFAAARGLSADCGPASAARPAGGRDRGF